MDVFDVVLHAIDVWLKDITIKENNSRLLKGNLDAVRKDDKILVDIMSCGQGSGMGNRPMVWTETGIWTGGRQGGMVGQLIMCRSI